MLQTLGDLFVSFVMTIVKLTLDSFGPSARAAPEGSDLPDSRTLIAHFQSMRDAAARRTPPPSPNASQASPNAPRLPPNAPLAPPSVPSPPANAANAHEPPAIPAAAPPQSTAAGVAPEPVQPARFGRPDSDNADVQIDREAFEALRLETPPPGAPVSAQGLPASPVRHGAIDPALAHEFAVERAKQEPPPVQTRGAETLPLSPAHSGRLDEGKAHDNPLLHEWREGSLTATWAWLPHSPVVSTAPVQHAPAPVPSPGAAAAAAQSSPAHAPPASPQTPPADASPASTWPELPQWPAQWDEPQQRLERRFSAREGSWYV